MAAGSALAQQRLAAMPTIGFFGVGSPGPFADRIAAFRDGLRRAGFVEGRNVAIEFRWTEGRYDQLAALAAELVDRRVDVLVTGNGGGRQVCDRIDTACLPIPRRPCQIWLGRQPQQTGLEPHRREYVCVFPRTQAVRIAARGCS